MQTLEKLWCNHCGEYTWQSVYTGDSRRSIVSNYRFCRVCHWWLSDFSNQWLPVSSVSIESLSCPQEHSNG